MSAHGSRPTGCFFQHTLIFRVTAHQLKRAHRIGAVRKLGAHLSHLDQDFLRFLLLTLDYPQVDQGRVTYQLNPGSPSHQVRAQLQEALGFGGLFHSNWITPCIT